MTQPNPSVWVDPAEDEIHRDAIVGDLRVPYHENPADAELADLAFALHESSPNFVERWAAARPARYPGMRRHIEHPEIGPIVRDGEVLQIPGCDIRMVVYTALPGTQDAARLAQLTTSAPASD